MRELICIVCPKGCHLCVEEENGGCKVTGHSCEKGEAYGRDEMLNPTRVITSTVRILGGAHRRCPVKTNGVIPKHLIFDAMQLLNGVLLIAPVHIGQVVVENILGTGVCFVASRSL